METVVPKTQKNVVFQPYPKGQCLMPIYFESEIPEYNIARRIAEMLESIPKRILEDVK